MGIRCRAMCTALVLAGHAAKQPRKGDGGNERARLQCRSPRRVPLRASSAALTWQPQCLSTRWLGSCVLQNHDAYVGHTVGAATSAVMATMMGLRLAKTKKVGVGRRGAQEWWAGDQ